MLYQNPEGHRISVQINTVTVYSIEMYKKKFGLIFSLVHVLRPLQKYLTIYIEQ